MFNCFRGKKVLILDTETTDIPIRPKKFGKYYKYTKHEYYKRSRLLSISWIYIDNYQNIFDEKDIKYYIRKPYKFDQSIFSKSAIELNHLDFDKCMNEGVPFAKIVVDFGLRTALNNCEFIFGHNVNFDFNILCHELSCYNNTERILEHLSHVTLIDTMELGKYTCKIPMNNVIPHNKYDRNILYKSPTLCEYYRNFYHEDPIDQHDSKGDLITLIKCLQKQWK